MPLNCTGSRLVPSQADRSIKERSMTTVTDERKSVAEVAEEQGWQRRVSL
jgi:hypothetical protein